MSKFVHLHSHTEYSLLDGLSKIKELVKRTKELGMDALAITDHGVMYGAIEFYKACREAEIKPIIGCEMYVAPRSHKSKEGKADAEPYHLTILAKNHKGYQNLMKLVSIAHLDGFYYKPRVDKELLKQYSEGLICLSGCPAGEFIRSLDSGGEEKAEKTAREYLEIFGEGNYYFELQNHHYDQLLKNGVSDEEAKKDLENMDRLQNLTWEMVKKLSPKLGVPIVATNDFHYVKEGDAEAQDALVCVATGKQISDINRLRMVTTPNLYLKSPEEMLESFKEIPEAIENSVKIADSVDLEIDLVKAIFPPFKTPEDKPSMEYLREITYQKAEGKLEITDVVRERLDYELEIIGNKKLSDYFLVVADFIEWSHEQGIITNTRGSAAGSLVLYCLGVTSLNPLDYLLPFERFLTKDRPYMPDIDADLADDRRDEVIHYLMSKYGEDKVAHITTFGTMMGRAAIRDVGRVLGVPYGEVDRIAKLVPPPKQGFHTTLSEHIKQIAELKEIYNNNPQYEQSSNGPSVSYKKLLDLAVKLEGTVRHASVHAAGILITPTEITDYTPLSREANGDKIVSQYDMYSVVDEYGGLGLVKMDLLGIRNLSILGRSVEYVKKNRGISVNIDNLPLDDQKTYDLLARGETMGVFQLSSSGMTKWLMELRPKKITDLSAMVALYRPGPMGSIPDYIERAHDPSKIKYFDPRMKSYMEQSLGILVYQEDVLYTAINIAGYPWDKADKFRKAMGKKKPEEMEKQKIGFLEGCVKNGMSQEKAEQLFALIAPFAAYGFGKAHAASYAMVAYQTAYMKANFPVEYMAAVMTAEYGDMEKIAEAIAECKRMKITVLHPEINASKVGFTIEDLPEDDKSAHKQGIRFGLSAIKNVGISAIESILSAREQKLFTSLKDLCSRVDTRLVNKKTLEGLIKAGALDNLGSRAALLLALEECLEEVHKSSKARAHGQESLFGEEDTEVEMIFKLPEVDELPLEQLLIYEKELLGFYLHEPPYAKALNQLPEYVSSRLSGISEEHIGRKVTLGGVISEVKKVMTKKSAAEMAFVRIFDGTSEIECVVFPKTFAEFKSILLKEQVLLIDGKIDRREDEFSLIVDSLTIFDPESAQPKGDSLFMDESPIPLRYASMPREKKVQVKIPQGSDSDVLKQVNLTLRQFPGSSEISLLIPNNGSFKKLDLNFKVDPGFELIEDLEKILGNGAVTIG